MNSYSTEVSTGRYDSSFGLVLLGTGDGNWQPLNLKRSGFKNRGDAKGMVSVNYRGQDLILVANNDAAVNYYSLNRPLPVQQVFAGDQYAMLFYSDGRARKVEFYDGSGYISQSSRSFSVDKNVVKIIVTDGDGQSRELKQLSE